MTTSKYKEELNKRKGAFKQVQKDAAENASALKQAEKQLRHAEQAREMIKEAGLLTQRQLQYNISDITSLALESVFPDPYAMKVDFVERRNKTECDLHLEKNGELYSPTDSTGGGVVDVASFALRVASWAMKVPRTRNTIILDEPFRYLSKEYQERASKMLRELSDKLGIQFIIVTHEDILTQYADKVFKVKQKNKRSFIDDK